MNKFQVLDLTNYSLKNLRITSTQIVIENEKIEAFPLFPHTICELTSNETLHLKSTKIFNYDLKFKTEEAVTLVESIQRMIQNCIGIFNNYIGCLNKGIECFIVNEDTSVKSLITYDLFKISLHDDNQIKLWEINIKEVLNLHYCYSQGYLIYIKTSNQTFCIKTDNFQLCKTIYFGIMWSCTNNSMMKSINLFPLSLINKRFLKKINFELINNNSSNEYNDTKKISFKSLITTNPSNLKENNNRRILQELSSNNLSNRSYSKYKCIDKFGNRSKQIQQTTTSKIKKEEVGKCMTTKSRYNQIEAMSTRSSQGNQNEYLVFSKKMKNEDSKYSKMGTAKNVIIHLEEDSKSKEIEEYKNSSKLIPLEDQENSFSICNNVIVKDQVMNFNEPFETARFKKENNKANNSNSNDKLHIKEEDEGTESMIEKQSIGRSIQPNSLNNENSKDLQDMLSELKSSLSENDHQFTDHLKNEIQELKNELKKKREKIKKLKATIATNENQIVKINKKLQKSSVF